MYLEKENIDSYIPHSERAKVDLEDYLYDEKNDTYQDKKSNIYIFKQFV
jgi:patatin-like phospholipase/acyl hydrolase